MTELHAFGIITAGDALFMFMMAFLISTKNIQSALLFKFIPFLIGLASLFASLKLFGLV